MAKIMVFIDGTWLYYNTSKLSEAYGQQDFRIDFGKLPQVLAESLKHQLPGADVDIVRTYLFGSFASNFDLRDDDAVQRRRDFFDMLKEEYHYEVEVYPINFMGRRLRRVDRDPADTFEPQEKCVDIALASSMLYLAAVPGAYDVAIAVIGDQDFIPVLQYVRRLGKRVAIASIKGSCSPELADPRDESRVKDFDVIWFDDILPKLELKYELHQLLCESPVHKGKREVWTTFHPRKGRRFFCDACRQEFARQKLDAQREFMTYHLESGQAGESGGGLGVGTVQIGMVTRKISDRGFGFIESADGRNYFFHLSDLLPGLDFDEVQEGLKVAFEVKRLPNEDRAGAAQNVRRHDLPPLVQPFVEPGEDAP
jgi:cold shock CspA family protein